MSTPPSAQIIAENLLKSFNYKKGTFRSAIDQFFTSDKAEKTSIQDLTNRKKRVSR